MNNKKHLVDLIRLDPELSGRTRLFVGTLAELKAKIPEFRVLLGQTKIYFVNVESIAPGLAFGCRKRRLSYSRLLRLVSRKSALDEVVALVEVR